MTHEETRIFTNFDGWFFKRHTRHPESSIYKGTDLNLDDSKDVAALIKALVDDGIITRYEPRREASQGSYYEASYLFKDAAYQFLNNKSDGTLNAMQPTALMLNLRHNTDLLK